MKSFWVGICQLWARLCWMLVTVRLTCVHLFSMKGWWSCECVCYQLTGINWRPGKWLFFLHYLWTLVSFLWTLFLSMDTTFFFSNLRNTPFKVLITRLPITVTKSNLYWLQLRPLVIHPLSAVKSCRYYNKQTAHLSWDKFCFLFHFCCNSCLKEKWLSFFSVFFFFLSVFAHSYGIMFFRSIVHEI